MLNGISSPNNIVEEEEGEVEFAFGDLCVSNKKIGALLPKKRCFAPTYLELSKKKKQTRNRQT